MLYKNLKNIFHMFRRNTSVFHNCTINENYTFYQRHNKAYHMPTMKKHSDLSYFSFTVFVVCFFVWKYLFYISDGKLDSTFDNQTPDSMTFLQKSYFCQRCGRALGKNLIGTFLVVGKNNLLFSDTIQSI